MSRVNPVRKKYVCGEAPLSKKNKCVSNYPARSNFSNGVNDFIKLSHDIAKEKGWWREDRNDAELIALMHSELSEALEAMREHRPKAEVAEELADCCIRIFDFCGARQIDLEEALNKKLEYNKTRPFRHGNKKY